MADVDWWCTTNLVRRRSEYATNWKTRWVWVFEWISSSSVLSAVIKHSVHVCHDVVTVVHIRNAVPGTVAQVGGATGRRFAVRAAVLWATRAGNMRYQPVGSGTLRRVVKEQAKLSPPAVLVQVSTQVLNNTLGPMSGI